MNAMHFHSIDPKINGITAEVWGLAERGLYRVELTVGSLLSVRVIRFGMESDSVLTLRRGENRKLQSEHTSAKIERKHRFK